MLLSWYKRYTGLWGDLAGDPIAFGALYYEGRVKSPYLGKSGIMPRGPSYPTFKSEVIRITEGKIVLTSSGH